jgi:hypothetical protein
VSVAQRLKRCYEEITHGSRAGASSKNDTLISLSPRGTSWGRGEAAPQLAMQPPLPGPPPGGEGRSWGASSKRQAPNPKETPKINAAREAVSRRSPEGCQTLAGG